LSGLEDIYHRANQLRQRIKAFFLQKKTPIPTKTELAFYFLCRIVYSNLNGVMILVPGLIAMRELVIITVAVVFSM
jgi:hypothetical protein